MVAATATSTTEKRSTRLRGAGFVAVWLRVVGTATVITPLAAGAAIGRTACAPRAFFHPDCTVGPGVGRYAFTGSCVVGRSRALPPIGDSHPCPEDRLLR